MGWLGKEPNDPVTPNEVRVQPDWKDNLLPVQVFPTRAKLTGLNSTWTSVFEADHFR